MQTIIVPLSVTSTSARLWVCVTGSSQTPGGMPIKLSNGSEVIARSEAWRLVTAGGVLNAEDSRTFIQIVEVTGLSPRTRLMAKANDAEAAFVTLPAALPRTGERPFTVFLGSCYFGDRDRGVEGTVGALLKESQLDMKILCGDQVYLDFPSFVFGVPFSAQGKASLFLSKYLRNWSDISRYRRLLQEGSTYFTSDDHEFWNNFPNAATIIAPTWSQAGRDEFRRAARPLFDDFQGDPASGNSTCRTVKVGNLSFMVADTRLERKEGDDSFLSDEDMQKVVEWLREPDGPGVLVVGQPVFSAPQTGFFGGLKRRFADRNLSDYAQYRTLTAALLEAKRSVVILTGDVHYPRVTEAVRHGESGRQIIEVIASPAALVAGSHGKTETPPARFPANPQAGRFLPLSPINESRHAGDNFVLLEFTETPGKIDLQLKYWFIGPKPSQGPTIKTFLRG